MAEIARTGLLNIVGELAVKKGLQGLKVGDVLAAVVLEKSANDEVLLSLKGEKISARSEAALSAGDRIFLKVEDTSGKLVLKVVGADIPETKQAGDLIRERAPQAMNVGGDFAELKNSLRELLQKSPALREGTLGALLGQLEQMLPEEGASPVKLKAFVENSGIFYERKLAASLGKETADKLPSDLKSLILEAKVSARNAMEGNPGLREDLGRFLDVSEKILKDTEAARPANTLPAREGAQTAPRGSDIVQEGNVARSSLTRQAVAEFSDLRTVVSRLLEKDPALKKGPLGELLTRLEQAMPREEVTVGKSEAPVKNENISAPQQRVMTANEAEKGLPAADVKAFILDSKETTKAAIERNPALRGEEAPVSRKGPSGELLARLEQGIPREEVAAGKSEAPVKNENISATQQRVMTVKEAEAGLPTTDLKALILEAKETAKAAMERNPGLRGELDRFLDVSERVLKNTEIVQLANSLTPATQNTFWVVLPYGAGDRAGSVEWEVRQGSDVDGAESQSFSLTFNLSGLGKVKVDGLLSGGKLNCHFWGDDEEKARFMEGHLAEFSHSAEAGGVVVGSLACGVAKDSGGGHLQRVMTTSGTRLVDRRA